MTTGELFALSEKRGYIYLSPDKAGGIEAMSILLPSGNCAWTAEKGETEAEYRDRVSHEIGHCETGAFYTRLSAPTTKEKCEEQARRWQYENVVSLDDLISAIQDGCREAWQIAERLDVPEKLVRGAAAYYKAKLGREICK